MTAATTSTPSAFRAAARIDPVLVARADLARVLGLSARALLDRERARRLPPADDRLGRRAAYRAGVLCLYLAPGEACALAGTLRLSPARVEAAVVQAAPHAEKVWLDWAAGRAPAGRELAALLDAARTLEDLRSSTSRLVAKRLAST